MALPFSLLIDTTQPRNSTDYFSTLVGAQDWDPAGSTTVFIDGISGTVMGLPACLGPGWLGANSGINAKFGRANFTLTDSANWKDNLLVTGDGPFMKYMDNNTAGVSGVTTTALPANQAVLLEFFRSSNTATPSGCMQGGWNSIASGVAGVSFRLYEDGKFELWKDGNMLGTYSMSGKSVEYGQTDQLIPAQNANQYMGVLLIPGRQRELIVISTQGGGFCHVFEDIAEGTPNAVITAATNFWFYVPQGCEANLRIAPLQFYSGTALGKKSFWKSDPGTATISGTQAYVDAPGGSSATVTAVDGDTPTNPYSTFANGVRVSVALTAGSNGTYVTTPFLYGARAWISPNQKITTGEGFDLASYVDSEQGVTLEVPDQWSGTEAHGELINPNKIQQDGAPDGLAQNIAVTCYRPAKLFADNIQLLEGVMLQPELIAASGLGSSNADTTNQYQNERVSVHFRDLGQLAADYLFDEPIPLDGMALDDAYNLVCSIIGVPSQVSSSFHSFTLPEAGNPTASKEFNFLIEVGDTGEEVLDRLHKTFAGTAYHGISGNGTFQLFDTGDMPSAPVVTLYDDFETALTALGDPGSAQRSLFRKFSIKQLEPEANIVYVSGYDFRSKRPIVTMREDTDSTAVGTASGTRPSNWLGFRRKYGWIDPAITTIDLAQTVRDLLFQRLTQQRQVVEFECELASQLAKGDLVTLNFAHRPSVLNTPVVCRIKSFSTTFSHTDTNFAVWRPTRYVAQIGTDISPLHTRGTTVNEIAREWKLRSQSKQVKWMPNGSDSSIWSRPVITAA